tara:strand:- start:194 stop:1012 length:819 start_codon:yes stop_codon:yes gene_type:complete
MKSFLKKILPYYLVNSLFYLKNWNHNAYSFFSKINLNTNLSDFFIWSNECSQIEFVAENVRALISGKKIEVEHNFRFFDEEGEFITMQKYKSSNFFEKIILKKPKGKGKYFSFTHFVDSETSLENIFKFHQINNFKDISEQNKGYTTYFPTDSKFGGATVHGNFGGLSKNDYKRAKINLKKHIYTPIYRFESNNKYDLVFNNPTKDKLKIKIIMNESGICHHLYVPSLGTRFFNFEEYSGSISFESKLPVCRALVFKNPAPNSLGNFDVFHS